MIEMDRIGWENGTLVSKAKVTINGNIYEIEPEQYEGTTPLSAENMKQMEDNTENAINTAVNDLSSVLDSKIGYVVLENDSNIDNVKENGRYGVFNAKGTLPSGYNVNDNNVIIDCIMWSSLYGRQILHDVRTTNTYVRNLNNGIWQNWKQYTAQ